MIDDKDQMGRRYTISEVAADFHMQPSTLRYYEDIGLLTEVERTSGKRFYRDKHIHRLRTICCFKNAGMTIAQLQKFFRCEKDEDAHIHEIMELLLGQKAHLDAQMKQLEQARAHLQRKLAYYSDVQKAIKSDLPRPDWADYRCDDTRR